MIRFHSVSSEEKKILIMNHLGNNDNTKLKLHFNFQKCAISRPRGCKYEPEPPTRLPSLHVQKISFRRSAEIQEFIDCLLKLRTVKELHRQEEESFVSEWLGKLEIPKLVYEIWSS